LKKDLDINTELNVNMGQMKTLVCLQILNTRASSLHRILEAATRLKNNPTGPTRNIFSIQRCTRTWVEAQGGPFKSQSENKVFM